MTLVSKSVSLKLPKCTVILCLDIFHCEQGCDDPLATMTAWSDDDTEHELDDERVEVEGAEFEGGDMDLEDLASGMHAKSHQLFAITIFYYYV